MWETVREPPYKGHRIWRDDKGRRQGNMASATRTLLGLTALSGALFAVPAVAQDAAEKAVTDRAVALNTAPAADLSDTSNDLQRADVLNLSSTLSGAIIDLPAEVAGPLQGASLLDLDLSGTASGDVGAETAGLGYTRAFDAGGVAGLDIELEPRANVRFSDDESSALVGAIVRIGDDLREDGRVKKNTWYLFAGADAEAMTYAPDSARRLTSGELGWQDRVIVGDAQAGIGYRLGDADVSLGYYRREVSSFEDNDPNRDFNISEDAAAISFTWRR